jgi:hypothetical protein
VSVIEDLKSRGRDGYVVLPKPLSLKRGDKVQVIHGALAGHLAVFEGMKPRTRVEVLLTLLGTQRRVELPKADVRPAWLANRGVQEIGTCCFWPIETRCEPWTVKWVRFKGLKILLQYQSR